MPSCGSQCWLCDLPIRFDTYQGCAHGCRYCFVQRNGINIAKIKSGESAEALKKFIDGVRTQETEWCDWNIPLHWGGLSDPFQPVEREQRRSYKALQVFEQSKYPFVVSTKGRLIADDEYLELIGDCKAVVQISMACDKYDRIEAGAPTFDERVEMARKVARTGVRVNARVQPYMTQVKKDVMNNLERFADAGIHGVIFEGMKFQAKYQGLVKCGADFVYPEKRLRRDFEELRQRCHNLGMKFYSGENRLRGMGDSLTCCGVDGLDGFHPNTYNLNHILNGDKVQPTEQMKRAGTTECFASLNQTTIGRRIVREYSFADYMIEMYRSKRQYVQEVMGKQKASSES